MEVNQLAAQLFELMSNMSKMIKFRPKKVFKALSEEYQQAIELRFGEHILRQIVQTADFSFPSEDFAG